MRQRSSRVGRGAGALGARGAKKRRPLLGRGALQNFGGAKTTPILESFGTWTTPLYVETVVEFNLNKVYINKYL